MSNESSAVRTVPPFKIIKGGRSDASQPAPISGTPGQVEEARLAAATLRLALPELGQTVVDCLDEMCARKDSEVDGDIARYLVLKAAMERIGLRFVIAHLDQGLVRKGYLSLTWPERLVKRYPELGVFRPETHEAMALG